MKIAIVTDSTSYLPQETVDKYNITVVPIEVVFNTKTYREDIDITTSEFYDMLQKSPELPSTAQPSIGAMMKIYDKLAKEGYDTVISIHLASTISGFVNNLKTAAQTIDNINVVVYDSHITVRLMGYLAQEAARMAQQDKSVDEIIDRLDALRSSIGESFVVDDLKNLVKGGRLSNTSAVIGTVLNIKPLLEFDDESHKIVAYDKVRSMKKAKLKAEEKLNAAIDASPYPLRLLVLDADDPESGDRWAQEVHERYPEMTLDRSYFGPVIGTHLGKGALALAWIRDFDKS
ncbi:DegV family protein [Companilactobacillus zhachilii]|uniref:DegV family protein n=1 Tax=Companilactobacillus zhachilii TaxID=2304606 RepID=A0A386PTY1_9LACO|nr:DegV family protein [Companilactobacillus zhachilii]AYE39486.1 DegV family protein [Companilactobacillus zhachilii]MBL3530106.1 DegV family protein [Companilactobacillus zhachilii]